MNKHKTPKWFLFDDWGMGSDPFNFILYQKRGERWNAKGFYPSIESLLQSFYNRLIRTEPADPDLVSHIEAVSERVAACAAALFAQLDAEAKQREKRLSPREGT
ncbi:hypothetical protein ACFL1V_03140 [Pseudomonadota bacterium]